MMWGEVREECIHEEFAALGSGRACFSLVDVLTSLLPGLRVVWEGGGTAHFLYERGVRLFFLNQ